MASLHAYIASRQPASTSSSVASSSSSSSEREASILFLRILAAADYFTTETSLMRNVPPVDVDIILDPFVLNVFPRSLVGTAGWIVVVAVAAYFLAKRIASWIQDLISNGATETAKKTQ